MQQSDSAAAWATSAPMSCQSRIDGWTQSNTIAQTTPKSEPPSTSANVKPIEQTLGLRGFHDRAVHFHRDAPAQEIDRDDQQPLVWLAAHDDAFDVGQSPASDPHSSAVLEIGM